MAVFCEECRDIVEFDEKQESMTHEVRGRTYYYSGKSAYCKDCGNEVFVAHLRDYNLNQLDHAFRTAESLVTIDQIDQITDMYQIGKRPLSRLLGWGDLTLTRYLDGDIPTRQYSDVLLQLYNDAEEYASALESGKGRITDHAYRKSKEAVDKILAVQPFTYTNKIEHVVGYLIRECEDVTPLALQKLVYYTQSFYKIFNDVFLFPDDCEAWAHGPVYRQVFDKFRNYSFNPIEPTGLPDQFELDENEKAVLDSVIANFGCYSGKVLERMTHLEKPWILARKGLKDSDRSNNIINKDSISDYFENVKERHRMLDVSDICLYSTDQFNKLNKFAAR